MTLLNESLDLFFQFVEIFCVMYLQFMILTLSIRVMPYSVRPESWWRTNIMSVEDFMLYFFSEIIQWREVLNRSYTVFENFQISQSRGLRLVQKSDKCLLKNKFFLCFDTLGINGWHLNDTYNTYVRQFKEVFKQKIVFFFASTYFYTYFGQISHKFKIVKRVFKQ